MEIEDQEFLEEVNELCEAAESALLNIGRGEDFLDNYNEIFRAFHSVKGGAGMLGFDELQAHMHILENQIEKTKEKNALLPDQVDFFLTGLDMALKITRNEEVENIADMVPPSLSGDSEETLAVENDEDDTDIFSNDELSDEKTEMSEGLEINIPENENTGSPALATKEDSSNNELPFQILFLSSSPNNKIIEYISLIEEASLTTNDSPTILGERSFDIIITDLGKYQETQEYISNLKTKPAPLLLSEENPQQADLTLIDFFLDPSSSFLIFKKIIYGALKQKYLNEMLEGSLKLNIYQFKDLVSFLQENGKEKMASGMKEQIADILSKRKIIASLTS